MPRIPINELRSKDLADLMADWGEPKYRAKQVIDWIYQKPIGSFADMTNLPPSLRDRLDAEFILNSVSPIKESNSKDGTTSKVLLRLNDGKRIESVLMSYDKRRSVCVSSQVGCAFGCPTCATAIGGFERNLSAGEITDQVLHFSRRLKSVGETVTNIIFMGMGEPLVNFEAAWQAIENLTSPAHLGLGARKITISTAGIVPRIKTLGQNRSQVGLAVSLHAPNNDLRNLLVPANKMYPLETLIPACHDYVETTGRRISFEYVLIDKVNDTVDLAIELANILKGLNCYVNLIPYNPSAHSEFKPPHRARLHAFQEILTRHHVPNSVRLKRGLDIDAGCGQLRARTDKLGK
jgi:23S rRNA (adenine2503-C2)-methyltransferase